MSYKKLLLTAVGAVCMIFAFSISSLAQTGTVTADILNVRSSTSTLSPVVAKVTHNTTVELLAYDGSWYKVLLPDGQTGYVSAEFIEPGAAYYGVVTASSLIVRASTGTNYPAVTQLPYGSVVELLAYDGAWYKIRYGDGQTGYVSAEFISQDLSLAANHESEQKSYGYINATALNIRQSTSLYSPVLTFATMGTKVELLAYDGTWYKLIAPDGQTGYASAEFISLTPVESAPSAVTTQAYTQAALAPPASEHAAELGNRIIATAYTYLGTPYVYGASGPSGFDCSGFTMHVLGKHGITLPHQSGSQYLIGSAVEKENLVTGDLVFFNSATNPGVAHVGIYISDSNFIHASSGKAYSVTVSSLNDDYYLKHYLGARRVI